MRENPGMKIAILGTRGIPARYGGFETFAEKLASGLSAHGLDVTVFCEAGGDSAPEVYLGAKLQTVTAPSLGHFHTILYDLKCLWAARKGYDVVYMLGYGTAPFCLIPRLWGTEVWINPDGLEWARAKWSFLAKCYFRLMEWSSIHAANRLIADAEAIAANLANRHGKIKNCTVIRYGCEVIESPPAAAPLAEWGLTPGSYYLVVCRLEPENHVKEILQAFQRSRSKKEMIVVGNHLTGESYVKNLRELKDTRIRMIGTVYDQQKLTCLRYHSFAYMHGHSVGGTNPSLLEAMGCGNLVFAHDNPFNRETLGPCGYYFADEKELTEAIQAAEEHEEELAQRREAAKNRARADYRWSDIVSSYLELLEQTASQGGKMPRTNPRLASRPSIP
jgi:glycosyltransferase involved in cell wall biosynthesis